MDHTSLQVNPHSAVMAEQTLSELVMNLISWIESLHEKNLKYEAQVETLSRDLALAREQLEGRPVAYPSSEPQPIPQPQPPPQPQIQHQQHGSNSMTSDYVQQHQHHLDPQQQQQQPHVIYQQMPATPQVFPPQQYLWTSSAPGPAGQVSYYDH